MVKKVGNLIPNTFGKFYLGELNFVTEGITVERRYGTALAALCFINFIQPNA